MSELWNLKGRSILVTGGSQGIGEAIVTMLASDAEVWIGDLPKARAQSEALAARFHSNVHVVDLDVCSDALVASAVEEIEARGKPLWGLVNNAGIVGVGGFLAPLDDYRRQWETNTLGSIRMAQAVLPGMKERGEGVIIQIASLGSLVVPHERAAYAVSKHGALAIPRIIAEEYGSYGIRAVGICPNRVSVPAALARAMKSAEDYADMHGTQQSGAMITPEQIAYLVRTALMPGMAQLNGDIFTVSDGALSTLRRATFPEGMAPTMVKE